MSGGYTYAYTGIDSDVIRCLRERRFANLLSFGSAEDHLFAVRENGFSARFLLDKGGVLRGWMNQIPEEIRFEIE